MTGAEEVVELLAQLVRIDSVNPSLVPGAAGEQEVAEFVTGWATRAGLSVEVIEAAPGRPSLVVRGGARAGGRTLLLCGHLDTVGTGGVVDPLVPRIDGDRMYGRGAYDMKCGLAAALIACRDATAAGLGGEVVVAAVADEEHSSIGVQAVLSSIHADAAIVSEPTELAIAIAHKGFVWTEIEVTGRAAHGSRPQLGLDAILKTGPVLVALHELDLRLQTAPHPLLGPGSLHGSLITGGREESTIPDRCVITVERRTLPGESVADVEAAIEAVLEGCRRADPELEVRARTTLARDPLRTDPATPVVALLASAAEHETGLVPEVLGVGFWADSAFISAAGIPTVLFGPTGDGAHADVEWVSLSTTVACTRILTVTAMSFCA